MPTTTGIEKYLDLLKNLLPRGRAWDFASQPTVELTFRAMAVELCRDEERVLDMLREADPRITVELLDDWERSLGLPDECTPENQTDDERRTQVVEKYTNVGGLSKTFYDSVIISLGFTGTVENNLNFVAGRSVAGDPLTNYFDEHFVAGNVAGLRLASWGWLYTWTVESLLADAVVTHFVAGSPAGDPLVNVENKLLECRLKKLKPAHTGIVFKYI